MKHLGKYLCALALAATVAAIPGVTQNKRSSADRMNTLRRGTAGEDRISREVRHELVMLPYYNVFDNLAYNVDGPNVTLYGQVTRPTLKTDAARAVKRIEGVEKVDNQIEVLPLSPADDRLRLALYRAIYGQVGLDRYALQSIPPIHIIVNNGKVTLVGVVASQADKDTAGIRANSVPGVFGVTNDLMVEGG